MDEISDSPVGLMCIVYRLFELLLEQPDNGKVALLVGFKMSGSELLHM